ncbi:glycosyltransferase family 2 protein [Dysgonomonas sp. Marseille-P4677]|uniref:glycosyltransferase family 2 protein n=1 Tax=Dysgonomonas sp. Marseille-P4677 TaxID=2364790 RepID=UPI0019126A42|nr:glycosyltransferase family A protein [Dysgonomonas sp. Marseille-P4677]MBK5722823.1 glycosyltransferase family 2 protein [Dysgonomonas sp. Marseille-P4677]
MKRKGFTVIMPTYNQSGFIRGAIKSLFKQTISDWELIVINDGSTDRTDQIIQEYLPHSKITYLKNTNNQGLGFTINQGLDVAKFEYIAYLPSDDIYYKEHLEVLKNELDKSEDIFLAYTKSRSIIKDSLSIDLKKQFNGLFHGYSLQLVQTAHKNTTDRWIERTEYVVDDLFDMFWNKLVSKGRFTYINEETCSWTIHTNQRHRLLNRGMNLFRQYYNIKEPLKIKRSKGRSVNEVELYKDFRNPCISTPKLKVLLVGELAYNPERIYALEEQGCQLFGLWMENPTFDFTMVGPIPFGNIIDIPYEDWESKLQEVQPDIIYAGLNFGSIPLAHEVLKKCKDIPFVWHFKEGPFISRQNGTWDKLIELYEMADGRIFLSKESKEWYEQFIKPSDTTFILDGDLPKGTYFTSDFSKCLSELDGEIHTVVIGRPIGIDENIIRELASHKVHLHLYHMEISFNKRAKKIAPKYFHAHPYCDPKNWVKEFSRYDAGWLHPFESNNYGDLLKVGWDDLNLPARMSTLAAAGLPMIQKDNSEHIVAMQSQLQEYNAGVFYKEMEDLATKLYNKKEMELIRNNILTNKDKFSFDYHVPELIRFFESVIKLKQRKTCTRIY